MAELDLLAVENFCARGAGNLLRSLDVFELVAA